MTTIIGCDMDGTLLDENSRLPEETFDLIRDIDARGIRFVAATGRRLDTLISLFDPVLDNMDFVASNGAQVMLRGKLLSREIFSRVALRKLVELVDQFDCMHLALFDRTRTFLLDDRQAYTPEFDKDLPEPVYSELPLPCIDIVKASINCDEDVMDMAYVLTRELGYDFVFAPSGNRWVDVLQRGVNKATGMREVMEYYGSVPVELIAFGDSMNDYELIKMAGHGYAMGNARVALKQVSDRVIGTNAEHAVQHELARILSQGE
ncbi:MAG: HAD family hydrolase [Coriobacteriales bacterium]